MSRSHRSAQVLSSAADGWAARPARLLSRLAAWLRLGALALLLSGQAATAQPSASPSTPAEAPSAAVLPAPVTAVEGITEYRLPNGLQLLLVPDDSKPTTTVNLTVRVGSRHENYGETGMAHLLEHMLFKGTSTTREPWAEFTRRGLRANGTTSFDRTNYFASFAADDANLRWYMGWLADALVNSLILREDLDSEMTVVRNEMEAGENNPFRSTLQQVLSTMYRWHNYGKSPIGARSDVENVDISRLQAFYRQHYQPDNVTLIVAGSFDPARVLAWTAELFGPIPKPERALPITYTLEPPQDGERVAHVRRVGGAPVVLAGYHVPAGGHPDYAAVELLALVLGDTPGGRLHRRIVERGEAAQAFAFGWATEEPGPLFLGLALAPGQDMARARAALAEVADGVKDEPVTDEELARARQTWLNQWEDGFSDPEVIGVSLSEAVALGDWRLYFLGRDEVRRVTREQVQAVAERFLLPDNRTVGLYEPTAAPQRAPALERVDVAARVQGYTGDATVAAVGAFDPTPANLDARTQRSALPSGLKLALLPKDTRGRAVQLRLRLHLGDVDSLQGQGMAAWFAAHLIDKGGAGMTRQQIADAFDRLQASVAIGASGQTLSVSASTRGQHLPALVELLGRLLREPEFAEEALEEARRQWLTAIERNRQEPGAVIAQRIARHANPYPRGDLRHSPSFDEQAEDVRAVTREQAQAFHRRFVSAARGEFAAVGDMDADAVRAAVASAFGDWAQPAGGPLPYVRAPQPLVPAAPARFVERTPDKPNANLMAQLRLPINDTHPDHPALVMANWIFGAATDSRLWTRIREREGLSYDVRASLAAGPFEPNASWTVTAIFAPENRARVETAFNEELARALREGFTQQELDEGRNGLLNFRRLARAQDASVAGGLAVNEHLDRTFAFAQQLDDRLRALTVEQVNAAWRRHIQPEQLVIAWGGDFKQGQ
jgi:zinc protease